MRVTSGEELFERLRHALNEQALHNGFTDEQVSIRVRPITPQEAIGKAEEAARAAKEVADEAIGISQAAISEAERESKAAKKAAEGAAETSTPGPHVGIRRAEKSPKTMADSSVVPPRLAGTFDVRNVG